MLSGRSKKEYAKEAEAAAGAPDAPAAIASNGAATDALEAVVAMGRIGRRTDPLRSAAPSDIQQCLGCRADVDPGSGVGPRATAMEGIVLRPELATTRNARGRRDLSPRELEVLALVAYGRSDGEIAAQLFITKKTASVHVAHIKDKLGVENRVEIAMAGVRLGLVRPTTEAR